MIFQGAYYYIYFITFLTYHSRLYEQLHGSHERIWRAAALIFIFALFYMHSAACFTMLRGGVASVLKIYLEYLGRMLYYIYRWFALYVICSDDVYL